MIEIVERLRGLLAKATPGDLSTAERHTELEAVDCPLCGTGEVDATEYCNFDGVALGVQFYGIGPHFGAHEQLWLAVVAELPGLLDTIETLTAENAALKAAKWDVQHADTANTLVQMGMARDAVEAENKRLREAGKVAEEALAAVIRLAEMDFEESMLEPEENGNFASYEQAKRALVTIRAAIGDAS